MSSATVARGATSGVTSLSVLVPVYNERYLVATSLERLQILARSPDLERVGPAWNG
jgi:hypothetical protein